MGTVVSLGQWVRRRRKALDLTQEQLAARVACSKELVSKIEADQRRPSRQIARLLATHLDLDPEERECFVRVARSELTPDHLPPPVNLAPLHRTHVVVGSPRPPHNLPAQLTPLVGRAREVAELTELLVRPDTRLITLTGPGGVGKTRLALSAAESLLDLAAPFTLDLPNATASSALLPDGAWYIDLAPLTRPAQLLGAIRHALSLPEPVTTPEEALHAALRSRRLLLLLDGFEHLLDGASLVSDLLRGAPGLTVLATSRAPLHLSGECVWLVEPLEESQAVALFVERARSVQRGFAPDATALAAVAAICQHLNGLPLAIELAAARVRLFTPQELLAQLASTGPLGVVVGGVRSLPARQQTLRATLEWSYGLLSQAEQVFMARLSVFVGGFTLAAATAVCGFDGTTIELLAALVDQSLVQRAPVAPGETRFRLLATVHEFAREVLAASGVAHEARRRHALYMLEMVEATEPHLLGAQQGEWRRRLMLEHENILAALTWSQGVDGDPTIGLRIAAALLWYWKPLGYRREGLAWLEATLARCENADGRQRAKALHAAGTLSGRQGSYTRAEAQLNEALTLCRSMDDGPGMLDNLSWLCIFAREQGDFERATTLFEECLALARQHDQPQAIAAAASGLGDLARAQGDIEGAQAWFAQALPAARLSGDVQEIGWVIANMGRVALAQGDTRRAEELFVEGRALFEGAGLSDSVAWMHYEDGQVSRQRGEEAQATRQYLVALAEGHTIGLPLLIACALEGLAALRSTQRPQHAARLLGAASQIRMEIANPLTPYEQTEQARLVSLLRDMLGEPTFANAWQAGSVLTADQAIDEARRMINV